MNFDYLYLLSFIFFFICFVSVGYLVVESIKYRSIFNTSSQRELSIDVSKFLNYETYLQKRDYIPYEKYEIWRFYFPS